MSYCSIDDITDYLSPHRPYPVKVQDKINRFIKDIDVDIDSLLTRAGVKIPIPNTETKLLDFLKYWATIGSSAKTELSLHGPNEDPRVLGYGQMLWRMYEKWKQDMIAGMYDIYSMLNDKSLLMTRYKDLYGTQLWSATVEDEVETIFKRDEDQW